MSKKYSCPFCGQKEAVAYKAYITLAGKDVEGYAIYCESCGARGPNCPLKRQAVEKWNNLVRTLEFYSKFTEEAESEVEGLRRIIQNLMPWAVRYANRRRSCVTSAVNEARTDCIKVHGMKFSRDETLEDKNGYALDEDLGRWDENQRKFIGEES